MTALAENVKNARVIRTRLCANCNGTLAERCVAGKWVVVCIKGCETDKTVSRAWVERKQKAAALEVAEVAKNYPELNPDKPLPAEERKRLKQLLYGD